MDTDEMEEASPCLKIFLPKNPIPSLPNRFPFRGETGVENSPGRICYVPGRALGTFQSWGEIGNSLTHCLCLDPSLEVSSMSGRGGGDGVTLTGFSG